MSLKQLLGLDGISDFEIMMKLMDAQKQDLDEVDFVKEDGSVVKVRLPHLKFDPFMFVEKS
ncbi:hypothetical protein KY332_01285 [Candidatus Woesearchaeota archaeon]|nr:hypothetical protein [Candidatus Woesearchaeota archaeon]